MEKLNGSFTSDNGNYQREDFLFTYSEEEKQENEINRNNAQLVLKPEYLTINYEMLHNGFTRYECALYSFIKFFLSNNDRFYCSNEQLAEMLNIGERSISSGIEKLQKADLIKTKTKIRAGGGKIRFIELQKITVPNRKICDLESQKPHDIYNNIIEDNLSNSNELDNIYSPKENFSDLNSNLPVTQEIEHLQAPVTRVDTFVFYDLDDPYVQSMMKNKNFKKNNIDTLNKLIKKGYTQETIQTVLNFIKQDEFWSKQIRSLPKLLKKNPDGVMYIDVMLDKIKQWKPKCVDLDALYGLNK